MGLIREPLNVDFVVDPKPLTQEEKNAISQYIRKYKATKANKKHSTKKSNTRKK